jgi:hypothetical protein
MRYRQQVPAVTVHLQGTRWSRLDLVLSWHVMAGVVICQLFDPPNGGKCQVDRQRQTAKRASFNPHLPDDVLKGGTCVPRPAATES